MAADSEQEKLFDEVHEKLPSTLYRYLDERDGAMKLVNELPKHFTPEQIAHQPLERRVWELVGLFYFNQPKRRIFEAVSIFHALYQHMLVAQTESGARVHKGMPLLWIAECYGSLGFSVLRKRYLMLALCEDAITDKGIVKPDSTGVYFRLVWRLGMGDTLLQSYAAEVFRLATDHPNEARYPEWVLQKLDQDWRTELPSPDEANLYVVNTHYIKNLLEKLGRTQGAALEELAEYIMVCMPGCRTSRRQRSLSTDYDIVCSMEGFEVDFRSELGRFFLCECKDWSGPANFTSMAKFCRVLDSVKSKFGILFSKEGISGAGDTRYAEREQFKVFQDRAMVIVVIDMDDLNKVVTGASFINILRRKYERVRLDLADIDAS